MTLLTCALNFVAAGWPVFPCVWLRLTGPNGYSCACLQARECRRPGKHPFYPAVPRGLSDASTDPAVVRAWWLRWPCANIGLVCGGPGGRWVLDIDGAVGAETLRRMEAAHGDLPTTLEARTGSGGRHLIFRWPGRKVITRQGFPGPGLDVRGDGGYIVAPPSRHVSGQRYAWTNDAPVRGAPVWLLEQVMEAPEPVETPRPACVSFAPRAEVRAVAYTRAYPAAISGQNGHTQTFRLAVHLVRGFGLSEQTALNILRDEYNPRCQPKWSEKELRHKVSDATKSKERLGYLLEKGRR